MRREMFMALAVLLAVTGCVPAPPPSTQAAPPATQAAQLLPVHFINVDSTGNRIVFISDASGSMIGEFDTLRLELRKAIDGLRLPQSFNVVFDDRGDYVATINKSLLAASPENKREMYDYIDKYTPLAAYDPMSAIRVAFAMHPDVIFFLCDPSDFPDPKGIIRLFQTLNADGKCRVNTIDFMGDVEDKAGEALLKQIAADSKGTFSYVTEEDLAK
jgi:hypothetical protein